MSKNPMATTLSHSSEQPDVVLEHDNKRPAGRQPCEMAVVGFTADFQPVPKQRKAESVSGEPGPFTAGIRLRQKKNAEAFEG